MENRDGYSAEIPCGSKISSKLLHLARFLRYKHFCVLQFFIYLFGVLRRFQHCTGHIMTGSWKGKGNQYIQFVRVLNCKLPTNGKQLPAFPLETVLGTEPGLRSGRRECYHSLPPWPLCNFLKIPNGRHFWQDKMWFKNFVEIALSSTVFEI